MGHAPKPQSSDGVTSHLAESISAGRSAVTTLYPGRLISGCRFWCEARDGDAEGFALARRHYSADKNPHPKQRKFVGPGELLVLISPEADALFTWRKSKFVDACGVDGVNCTIFRYDRPSLTAPRASELLLEAMELAWKRWPGERLYTYVNPRKVASGNPGYCFKQAGWALVRTPDGKALLTKRRKLLVLAIGGDH